MGLMSLLLIRVVATFLVQLTNDTTLLDFLHSHPKVTRLVSKTFSFGDFNAFAGKFDVDTLKGLNKNLYVSAITPDVKVRVDESQKDAPRHLARISRREKLLPGKLIGTYRYVYFIIF